MRQWVPEELRGKTRSNMAVVAFAILLLALLYYFGQIWGFIVSFIDVVKPFLLGFGIVQIGLSLKSHDPSQRANGIMTVAGGVVITFAKEIMNLIVGGGGG